MAATSATLATVANDGKEIPMADGDERSTSMKESAKSAYDKAKASAQAHTAEIKAKEAAARAKAKESFEAHKPKKSES
ncbi:MAG TPA: hypothetical protein VFA56_14160 [Gaiellaceae bacterium]|nr:hypothetical protein [Gaiellaceae bacterium]